MSPARLYAFDRVQKEHRDPRMELVAFMAVLQNRAVLVVAHEHRLQHWKTVMPKGMFSYTRPDAHNLRRNPLPGNTFVLLDPELSRPELAALRSKALQERSQIVHIS